MQQNYDEEENYLYNFDSSNRLVKCRSWCRYYSTLSNFKTSHHIFSRWNTEEQCIVATDSNNVTSSSYMTIEYYDNNGQLHGWRYHCWQLQLCYHGQPIVDYNATLYVGLYLLLHDAYVVYANTGVDADKVTDSNNNIITNTNPANNNNNIITNTNPANNNNNIITNTNPANNNNNIITNTSRFLTYFDKLPPELMERILAEISPAVKINKFFVAAGMSLLFPDMIQAVSHHCAKSSKTTTSTEFSDLW